MIKYKGPRVALPRSSYSLSLRILLSQILQLLALISVWLKAVLFIMKVATVFLNAFVAAALGVPMEHVLHEKRGVSSITKREALPAEQTVPVRIALKQTNLEKGMDLLIDV